MRWTELRRSRRARGVALFWFAAALAPAMRAQEAPGVAPPPPVTVVDAWFPAQMAAFLPEAGAWLPLYVELRAVGDRPRSVTVQATVTRGIDPRSRQVIATYSTRVEVPPGEAPRRVWLPVRASPDALSIDAVRLEYSVGGETLPLSMLGVGGSVSLHQDSGGILPTFVVADEPEGLDEISPWSRELSVGSDEGDVITHGAVERVLTKMLPDSALGYHGVRLVVLRGVDSSRLEESQQQALEQWVAGGGTVVLSPSRGDDAIFRGALARALLGSRLSEPSRLDDVAPQWLHEISHGELAPPSRRSTEVRGRDGRLDPARTLEILDVLGSSESLERELRSSSSEALPIGARPDGPRLYAEVSHGAGRVGVLGFDDRALSSRGRDGAFRAEIWRTIVTPALRPSSRVGLWSSRVAREVRPDVSKAFAEDEREVGTLVVVALIAGYLLLVGPGVYFLLKRRGRLPSIIWVEPLVIVAYLIVIFAVGFVTKGYLTKARELVIVHVRDGERFAFRESYLALFSADDTDYVIGARRGDLLLPIWFNELEALAAPSRLSRVAGEPGDESALTLRGVGLSLWQQGVFLCAGLEPRRGSVSVVEDEAGGYRVRNDLRRPILGGWLISPRDGSWLELPEIAVGAEGAAVATPGGSGAVERAEREFVEAFLRGPALGHRGATRVVAIVEPEAETDFTVDRSASRERLELLVVHDDGGD